MYCTCRALEVSIELQVRMPGIVYEYLGLGRKGQYEGLFFDTSGCEWVDVGCPCVYRYIIIAA